MTISVVKVTWVSASWSNVPLSPAGKLQLAQTVGFLLHEDDEMMIVSPTLVVEESPNVRASGGVCIPKVSVKQVEHLVPGQAPQPGLKLAQ